MSTSTTGGVGGFTGEEIDDVARTVAISLGIKYDGLTEEQKAGYSAAARGALTSERPKGFASHMTDRFGPVTDEWTEAEKSALDAATRTKDATENEFWKFARDEFDRRRG